MFGLTATYAVAIFAILFAVVSAPRPIYTVEHLASPETHAAAAREFERG